MRVLFDGWLLSREPGNPAALFLLELLAGTPTSIQLYLALPEALPVESNRHNPVLERVEQVIEPVAATGKDRLIWEQAKINRIAQKVNADLVHLTTHTPALLGRTPVVISPANLPAGRTTGGFSERLRLALAAGGMAGIKGLFWPDVLPAPDIQAPVYRLPDLLSPDFNPVETPEDEDLAELDLPQEYLLYHGPQDRRSVERLLAIWSWAAGSIGELYPLVILGFEQVEARQFLQEQAQKHQLDPYLQILPSVPGGMIPAVYRGSSAVLHLGETPAWGGALRHALACRKPLVADATPRTEALVGPAGFLFSESDTRRMGAALLSVVVNEDVANNLQVAAGHQVTSWQTEKYQERLLQAYHSILGS